MVALGRGFLLAAAALLASEVEAGHRGLFLAVWGGAFAALALPLALLELPLVAGLPGRRAARAAAGAALGIGWGLLLVRLAPLVRSLGWSAPCALALGGLGWTPGRDERRWRPRRTILGAALLALSASAALALDPEARYAARSVETRASAALRLAAPPAFPDRDPASLADLELARAIAADFMRAHPPERLRWSWEEAVAVMGLLTYGGAARDPAPLDFARAWVDAHAAEALSVPLWADAAAPAIVVLALGRERPGPCDAEILARVDDHVARAAPRTRRGALSHPGLLAGGLLPPEVWVDSLFMHGVYLDRRAPGEATALGRAACAALFDPATGFFRHAAFDIGPLEVALPVEPLFWGRGNGWAAYFLVDHALARGAAADPALARAREAILAAAIRAQDPASGLFRTDLLGPAGPANPLETSATALFTAALRRALAGGLFSNEAAPAARRAVRRGLAAIRGRVRWERGHPFLEGISAATHPGFRAYYRAIPLEADLAHGVGAALLALAAP
jgi:rhamnogalacturonyl hydrolase YesR